MIRIQWYPFPETLLPVSVWIPAISSAGSVVAVRRDAAFENSFCWRGRDMDTDMDLDIVVMDMDTDTDMDLDMADTLDLGMDLLDFWGKRNKD